MKRKALAVISLGVALLGGQTLAAPTVTTASDLLDEVIYELAQNYYGPAQFKASDLSKTYRPKVREACDSAGKEVTTCPSNVAYPLIRELLKGLGDKHNSFLTPEQREKSELAAGDEVKLSPSLGVTMLEVPKEEGADFDGLVVLEVIPGTPAAKAGWQVGDLVTAFNGFSFPMTDEEQKAMLETLEEGKAITFTMQRRGEPLTSEVVEMAFKEPAVQLTLLSKHTALLRLRHFDRFGIGQEVHDAVREAQSKEVTALILDLRRNTGGFSAESMLATGAFTQPAPQVNRRRLFTTTETYQDGKYLIDGKANDTFTVQNPVRFTGKLVVLVDDNSASAAEYLARDLQARPDTTVLGMTTVGVGNIGTLIRELSDGSGLQITVQQVEGENKEVVAAAVKPDIKLELDVKQLVETGEDNVLKQARELLK